MLYDDFETSMSNLDTIKACHIYLISSHKHPSSAKVLGNLTGLPGHLGVGHRGVETDVRRGWGKAVSLSLTATECYGEEHIEIQLNLSTGIHVSPSAGVLLNHSHHLSLSVDSEVIRAGVLHGLRRDWTLSHSIISRALDVRPLDGWIP